MISRRENLLVRPWQERRYENHRRKVQSASAAIDSNPPQPRTHVQLKLKKLQNEVDRCKQIERENLLLLRKLSAIMKKNCVDNHWNTPQPNFLNRMKMFDGRSASISRQSSLLSTTEESPKVTSRKLKCTACNPTKIKENIKVPEERVPWEPQKQSVGRRSLSVPPCKLPKLPTISETKTETQISPKKQIRTKSHKVSSEPNKREYFGDTGEKILITRGNLKLSVNFPADSDVMYLDGRKERVLVRSCRCKNRNV